MSGRYRSIVCNGCSWRLLAGPTDGAVWCRRCDLWIIVPQVST